VKTSISYISRNPISLVGLALAVASITVFVVLAIIGLFIEGGGPYLGILTFVVVPSLLVIGMILVPIGLRAQRRRDRAAAERHESAPPPFPILDFNRARVRSIFLTFTGLTVVSIGVIAVGLVEGVKVMEGVPFCGQACHTPMQPEFTAYQRSAHSRVGCVDCHIGPGADWFVKSKLSGAWQLVAVSLNLFPRPIPTPIPNLRPARDTCEQCHWPEKFTGDRLRIRPHYDEDEANTEKKTVVLVKVGGVQGGRASGIHWHVHEANQIRYRSDPTREKIEEVQLVRDGVAVQTYRRAGPAVQPSSAKASGEWRTMDCVDCHNRPAHTFRTPAGEIDAAIASGQIDRTLPFIKREGLKAIQKDHASHEAARSAIPKEIAAFYAAQYPQLASSRKQAIDEAGRLLADIYSVNVFPTMKVTWGTYPNHIGHQDSPGCFRCHDGEMKSDGGRVIEQDCAQCHSLLAVEEAEPEVLEQIRP
jgi:hypothetical protein